MNKTKFFSSMLAVALFATSGVLTSCKDYNDDIKDLQSKIDVTALKTDLEGLKTSLQTQLSSVQSSLDTKTTALQTAINAKADASTVNELASKVQDLTSKAAGLETQIAAINTSLADYAKTSDLEKMAATYATLTGDLSKLEEIVAAKASQSDIDAAVAQETAARIAAEQNLQLQIEALKAMETALDELKTKVTNLENAGYDDTELKAGIAALQEKLANYDAQTATVADLKRSMQSFSEEINDVQDSINLLNVFVNKRLTSLVLMPEFYWEGIEGIEIPAVKAPIFKADEKNYTFTYNVTGATLGNNTVTVKVTDPVMGFACTDGKVYTCEKANVWPTAADVYTGTAVGEDDGVAAIYPAFRSLIEKDGQALIPATTNLVYANISNGGVARYHVNPSTANLDGMTISFFENDAEVYTRAAGFIGAEPFEATVAADNKYTTFKNGILTVPFKVNNSRVWNMFYAWINTFPLYNYGTPGGLTYDPVWAYDSNTNMALGAGSFDYAGDYDGKAAKLPFLAAEVRTLGADNAADSVVTSDYAVVVPAVYDIVALADNAPEAIAGTTFGCAHVNGVGNYGQVRYNHLYESVGYEGADDVNSYGAIPMPATHTVKYNEVFKIDFVETHYDYSSYTKYGTSTKDKVMDEATMEALGLHYEYTLVNYIVGGNETGESVHMAQTDADGNDTNDKTSPYFTPRKVKADGTQETGVVPGKEAVDREPLIRVDLVDANGNIVRYGYIKVRIVADKESYNDMEVKVEFSDTYMNCGGENRMTWSQVERLILAELNNGEGMTKRDFEKNYYLEVVDPTVTDMPSNANGALYTTAFGNSRMANRYYYDDATKTYKQAAGQYDDGLGKLNSYKADQNWFGRVWYTPHDNSTASHDFDEATNVLVWNLMEATPTGTYAEASNMTRAAYEKMISLTGATYKTQGKSQKDLSTVVRFVNKTTGASIWVTLVIPAQKLFFAYADINNRVLDHWFDFKQGYRDGVANDTIEVYANVPTPAEVARTPLTSTQYVKDLKEYWLNKNVVTSVHNGAKFSKFTAAGNIGYEFKFTLPQKGTDVLEGDNTVDQDLESDKKSWKVPGISGATYTLYLSADKSQIWAKKQGQMVGDELICSITTTGTITYNGGSMWANTPDNHGGFINSAASDILNYIGYYDAAGKNQKEFYLTGQKNKGFTAYVEVNVTSAACYDPLMGNNKFNVRFLRPINVWPSEYTFTDAPNDAQFIDIWKLLYVRDWRTYAVVMDGKTQKFGASAKAGTGEDGKNHSGTYSDSDKSVPYSFYGISNLYVQRDEIRSDAYLAPANRGVLTDASAIEALRSVNDIPSLTNGGIEYLKIIATSQANASYSVTGTAGKFASTSSSDVIAYTNNGGVVKEFHIYVPISVEYPWGVIGLDAAGKYKGYTQKVWAVITVKPTTGNE